MTAIHFLTIKSIDKMHGMTQRFVVDGIAIMENVHKLEDHYTEFRHQFDGLLISYCFSGSMSVQINFKEYSFDAGSVAVVLPQLVIDPQKVSDDLEIISIALSLDFLSSFPILREFISNDQIRWQPVLRFGKNDQLLQKELVLLLQQFFVRQKSPRKRELLQYLIFTLITLLSEAYSSLIKLDNAPKSRRHKIIDDFYMLLSKYVDQQRDVKFYADKLHLTPQYLTTVLKSETGKSISQWIDYVAIMHAKTMLRSSDLSIKAISANLAFGDSSLFCRYFKRHTGLSPVSFRNKRFSSKV